MVAAINGEEWVTVSIRCVECREMKQVKVRKQDLAAFERGESYVQNLFPYLNANERELFISRICGQCWDRLFPEEEEYDD
jgi:hypothetical protein